MQGVVRYRSPLPICINLHLVPHLQLRNEADYRLGCNHLRYNPNQPRELEAGVGWWCPEAVGEVL